MADGSAGSLVGPARPALVLLAAVRDDLLRLDRPEPVEPLLIQDVPLDQLQRGEGVDHAALGLLVGAARLGPPEKGRDRASRVGTGTSLPRKSKGPPGRAEPLGDGLLLTSRPRPIHPAGAGDQTAHNTRIGS